jgi:hypothetical protein
MQKGRRIFFLHQPEHGRAWTMKSRRIFFCHQQKHGRVLTMKKGDQYGNQTVVF